MIKINFLKSTYVILTTYFAPENSVISDRQDEVTKDIRAGMLS